jgi:hypothetical protein
MLITKLNPSSGIAIVLVSGYIMTAVNVSAGQNVTMPDNMTGSINITNATSFGAGSLSKNMGEAIKALESGNKEAASTHLAAAEQGIALSECERAKMHFNETMKAFSLGDSKAALMHLKSTNNALD